MANDMADHFESLPEDTFIPPELLNSTIPWRLTEEYPDPLLENFVPSTSSDKYRFDQQVNEINIYNIFHSIIHI